VTDSPHIYKYKWLCYTFVAPSFLDGKIMAHFAVYSPTSPRAIKFIIFGGKNDVLFLVGKMRAGALQRYD